jgi:hypothetical protein
VRRQTARTDLKQPRRLENMEAMPYGLPADVDERPVCVIGGGTPGRRIAGSP